MQIAHEQRKHIQASIRDKYGQVAAGRAGKFKYPTGQAGLSGLGYHEAWTGRLPPGVLDCFCGVGNPFSLGLPGPGARVLDVGSGCGVDTLVAAILAGPDGRAVGVESTPEMLAKARENATTAGAANAVFLAGSAESLPLGDAQFDLVISNGVYNLVPDKDQALVEAFRVLKPGGRFQVADQMLIGPPPLSASEMMATWFT